MDLCYHSGVITIGTRRGGSADAVDALLECHDRIRQMIQLARRLVDAVDPPDGDVGEAAGRVRRYFAESLPMHVEDEERSLVPRLRGRAPEVDAALDRMAGEHAEHDALLARLVDVCARLERDPASLASLHSELDDASAQLRDQLAAHLDSEEQVLFPAVRRLLDDDERAAIRSEMRARRGDARDRT